MQRNEKMPPLTLGGPTSDGVWRAASCLRLHQRLAFPLIPKRVVSRNPLGALLFIVFYDQICCDWFDRTPRLSRLAVSAIS